MCIDILRTVTYKGLQGNKDLETLQEPFTEQTGNSNGMPKLTGSDLVEDTVAAENDGIVEETGRSKRKRVPRKHVLDTLNGCLCGEVVDPLKSPLNEIIKCKEIGCETEWVIVIFLVYLCLISLTLLCSITLVVLSWK